MRDRNLELIISFTTCLNVLRNLNAKLFANKAGQNLKDDVCNDSTSIVMETGHRANRFLRTDKKKSQLAIKIFCHFRV